jgi:LysR family transcriptional regulator, hca operon transcriptional activator
MELRHLRYFVVVAEEGSLTLAAKRLHTVQPSLSRQIRDLEDEVGVPLLIRNARGVELTPAGRVFLDQARLTLNQAEAAVEAARRAGQPTKPTFSMGFLTGQEVDWLPHATSILRDELPNIEVRVVSKHSPLLGEDLQRGRLDVAFLRREEQPDVNYKVVVNEPLIVVMPSDHALTAKSAIDPRDLVGERFLGMSDTAPVLRKVIDAYLRQCDVSLKPAHEIDNLAMGISMVASTRGVALLPSYAENFLPWSVVSRPLTGEPPTVELAIGYNRKNPSPVLKLFLGRVDDLIARFHAPRGKPIPAERKAPPGRG